jgi:hypothetical protein
MEICEAEGREIVDPYLGHLAEVHWLGWDNYHKKYQEVLHEHLPQNRSDLINRQIHLAAQSVLSGLDKVRFAPQSHGQFWVIIQELVAIRFKKLDRLLRASWNHGTRQSRQISRQQPPLGYPDYAWLNAGYIPNKLWSTIESMYLVHPRSETSIGWKISLLDEPQIEIDFDAPAIPLLPDKPESQTLPKPFLPRWQLKEGESLPEEHTHGSAR